MKYDKNVTPKVVCDCLRRGTSIKKTCNKLGIAESTFYAWMQTKSEFSEMVNETKLMISYDMDEALMKLAKGGTVTETTREPIVMKGEMVDPKLRITKKVTKRVMPDLKAIKYYKNNIDPKQWQDRKAVALSGEVDTDFAIHPEVQAILDEIKNDKD
jgi:transposase-like protein